jgi:hypothetical protein
MEASREVALRLDPSKLMDWLGFEIVDPWQRTLLRTDASRVLLLCSRQLGKSTCTACVALNEAYLNANALVLLVSPSERQSGELFEKVSRFHKRLQLVPAVRELTTFIELVNGSKIYALPGSGDTIRGFSAPRLVVIDEASRVPDDVLGAVLPMLVSNHGRLLCLSTPRGKSGFYYERWVSEDANWTRINARASESPRISPEAIAEQRSSLGPRLFSAEFDNNFLEDVDQVFSEAAIDSIFADDGLDSGCDAIDLEEI